MDPLVDGALLAARLLLAGVFAVAGVAKLADRAGSRQAMLDFGVPTALAPAAAVLLPLAELAVAVLLLPAATAWWGAVGALVLLLAFMAGIGVNLARGRRPNCHCFGQLHSAPVGWPTLARNGGLALVAALVVAGGPAGAGPSAVAWLGSLTLGEAAALAIATVALALAAGAGWLLVQVLRQNGRLMVRLDALEARLAAGGVAAAPAAADEASSAGAGLPVGEPAPPFRLSGLHGETQTLDALRSAGTSLLLLFTDPGCGPCTTLLPDIARWQRVHAGTLTIVPISQGSAKANRAKVAEHGLTHVLLQRNREVAEAYQVHGTPSAVLVQPDGTIGSPVAAGVDAIHELVARAVGLPARLGRELPLRAGTLATNGQRDAHAEPVQPTRPAGPRIGEPAPAIKLPDLDGKTVELAQFRGSKTLVLFWNPGCGFCARMVDDLKAWEADPPAEAPKLLVVSTGTVADNQAAGFRSPVVLDQTFGTGRAFGADGTPMAVLIDEHGDIASDVVGGAPAVLALAGAPPAQLGGGDGAPVLAAPRIGEPAPAISLPDLAGRTVELAQFRGSKTLVLFWEPGCGFCQDMLDDLKAWERKPPSGAPKLLVVSTGTVAENQAQGFRAPVLLDQNFSTGFAFGTAGTPSAVLVDADGTIASAVAGGAPPVLELAGAKPAPP